MTKKQSKNQKSILPGHGLGVKVLRTPKYPNGDINYALRIFKKNLKHSNRMAEIKARQEFTPKSKIRRIQKQKAQYLQKFSN